MLADHQIVALDRVLHLLATWGGAILADEAGRGKSFVAAAVAVDRVRLDREVDLIVPATLVGQWRETLDAFHVSAAVMTHDALLADARVPDPHSRRLVIVDEAHAFRNPRTQRYAALSRRAIAAELLLVTAAPICNSIADLAALLGLFTRDDILSRSGIPSLDVAFMTRDFASIETIYDTFVIRRDRSVLAPHLEFGELDRRIVRHPIFGAKGEVERLIATLDFPPAGNAILLRHFFWRRLESSEAALIESIRRQLRFYERFLSALAGGRKLPKREYRRVFGREEDAGAFQEVLFWDLWVAPHALEVDPAAIRREMRTLSDLRSVVEASPCTKRTMLIEICASIAEPALVFTGSIATARDIYTALKAITRCGIVTSHERLSNDRVLEAFRRGALDIIVSTDLAAEGLNLQHAGVVIHYDIPWNPVKLDQRNGRAWRIGQQRPSVRAFYFLPDTEETRIVRVMSGKNRERRRVMKCGSGLQPAPGRAEARPHIPFRPRLVADSAAVRFLEAARTSGFSLPDSVARRHKAGIDRLLDEMAREYLDRKKIDDLIALVAAELGVPSPI